MYSDSVNDLAGSEKNSVLYYHPINHDHLIIGKFCSIVRDAKPFFNGANHTLSLLPTHPFPLFLEEWGLGKGSVGASWDDKGDIVIGSSVRIGYEAVVMVEATTDDGVMTGSRAAVTKDIPSHTAVDGVPMKPIRERYSGETTATLLELKWQDWPEERITENIHAIQTGQLDELI